MPDQVTENVLEENSRQMDQNKKRLVFRTLTGNSELCEQKSTRCELSVRDSSRYRSLSKGDIFDAVRGENPGGERLTP